MSGSLTMTGAVSAAPDRTLLAGDVDGVALGVLIFFFALITVGGFYAARWRKPTDMESLHEWGLGGRGFGTVVTWFLLGGDLYTAYTFVAVPAAMYATGAISGFFAVPYTIVVYPLIFIFMPRLFAFAVLAAYTYSSGLRAPALIAFVKDFLIYLVIIVAVVYIAVKIGFGTMFDAAEKKMNT